jgi:hypothetical protein
MLGPAKLRRLDQPIAVSLEDLVPPDHSTATLRRRLTCPSSASGRASCTPTVVVPPLIR